MSTGKRLAKRSIIGTRVCAPGPDGLWYSGVIQDVKTPPSANNLPENNNCINLTPDTKYVVRFDFKTQSCESDLSLPQRRMLKYMLLNNISPAQSLRRNAMTKEFQEHELIGPGFRSIIGVQLHPGQRVFLTHNGREVSGDVLTHDAEKDEVAVKITPIGSEEPLELRKRLEEVRLLESRRSARLADQDRDTDFARLADMAGDRRRPSHSIDVPHTLAIQNSRKRPPSCSQDEREAYQFRGDEMDECNAALVLMSLSCSPNSPHPAWNRHLGSSPGSSNASWSSSGSSSPPLSDDFGIQPTISDSNTARNRTASTSDEGIVMDYSEEAPKKRRAHGPRFQCTWKGCHQYENTVAKIELHVRTAHLGPKKPRHSFDDDGGTFSESDHEEEFYYTEIEEDDKSPTPPSPPTLSHRDMARPPHEDPEFQRQIVGSFRQHNKGLLALSQNGNGNIRNSPNINAGPINIPTSPMSHQKYSWSQQGPASPSKLPRHSPRPSTSSAPYPSPTYMHQHHYNSPNGHHQSIQHSHLHQQHPQSVTSNSVHHSPTSTQSSIATLSHSAPAASTLSLAGHTPTMHLAPHHPQPHHHTVPTQSHHHQQIHQPHHHQQPPQQQVVGSSSGQHHQQSPKGRTRGENKKCRKVYGMDHRDQWCTQCKWKKACSRFGD
ncbi:zinc finger protein 704 isoform X2 [Hermetia illucens]|uniref:zinc finger protein 704 isoform X2 n=1 Tax=Hermetia illucens TaxID=343691 RepID=UPI0018CBFBA1|nr:zinc finger protein 704 isoform X2 [Hermetia illucens]